MNRALQIAHLALLIAATALIGVATWQGLLLARDMRGTVATANAALAHLGGPKGTISMLDEDIGVAKSAIIHADLIARHEQQQLTTLDAQERDLFVGVNEMVSRSSVTLNALTQAAHGATAAIATTNETIAGLQPLERSATQSVTHLDAVITDPAIPATLGSTEKITSDAARITKDAADEADKLAHPPLKKMGFWGSIDAALLYFHSHIAPPIF